MISKLWAWKMISTIFHFEIAQRIGDILTQNMQHFSSQIPQFDKFGKQCDQIWRNFEPFDLPTVWTFIGKILLHWANFHCDNYVTRWWNKKLPNFFPPEIAQKVATHFLHNSDIIRNSQKVTKIFWLLLWDNLLPRTCKNRPIWSHWTNNLAI